MKIQTYENTQERRILLGMMTSTYVLGRIASKWDGQLFVSSISNILGSLCVEHYKKHREAPNRAMETLYERWSEKHRDKDTARNVLDLLSSFSGEYGQQMEGVNPEHLLDLTGVYFNEVKLKKLKDHLESDLQAHDIDRAQGRINKHVRIELGVGCGIDLLNDKAEVESVFSQEYNNSLITFGEGDSKTDQPNGGLVKFFRDYLCRDSFFTIQGTDKSGKSMFLLDMAWRALLNRQRVAYFEAGDLSKKQLERRFLIRAALHPFRSSNLDCSWPCNIIWPTALRYADKTQGEDADEKKSAGRPAVEVTDKLLSYEEPLNEFIAWEACNRITKYRINSRKSHLKLSCHPNSTLTVAAIKSTLDSWEADDWCADVVIVDYADILAPPLGIQEGREQINVNWKQLRTLSQEKHCLLLTATQSNADAYSRETMDRRNFSDDKRKNAHTTGVIGLNVTPKEKMIGVSRLNWLFLRDGEYDSKKCVHIAGSLALCSPAVHSLFNPYLKMD